METEEGEKKGTWLEDIPLAIFSAQCRMMRWEIKKHVLPYNVDTVQSPVSVWCHPQTSNSSPLVIAHVCSAEHCSCNIMSISKPTVNAVANFVHAVGSIWVMQCGFKRLTEKRDLAESIASMSFNSNPLKQLKAINFCDRRAHQFSHSLPPRHLPNTLQTITAFSYTPPKQWWLLYV